MVRPEGVSAATLLGAVSAQDADIITLLDAGIATPPDTGIITPARLGHTS
ncbi:hypothetical protein ACWD6R_11220 [Streptomyces sp. NPDC005151]